MSNVLPPQANLFGFWDEDPRVVADVRRHLERENDFATVWTPADGWVAASMPLPYGREPAETNRALAFAEGADVVGALDRVIKLADEAPDRLDELPGDFGFIRFRPRGEATVVRSAAGLVPFYIRSTPTRVAISTLIGDLVKYDPTTARFDSLTCAMWASANGMFPDGRSFVLDVRVVRRGHSEVLLSGRPPTSVRYWDPRPARHVEHDFDAHAERARLLRSELIGGLERNLHAGGGNLVTLSGGVDSSSLAALAAGTAHRPIASISLLPPDDNSKATELSYIEPLVAQYGIRPVHYVVVDRVRRVNMLSPAPHGVAPIFHPALNEIRDLSGAWDIRVVFGGEFADEICGSAYTFVDWASEATLRAAIRPPNGPRDWLRIAKWKTLWSIKRPRLRHLQGLHEAFKQELHEEYAEWLRSHQRAVSEDRNGWTYRWAWSHCDGWIAMNWEALSGQGIRRTFPFVQREVLELAYSCHPADIVGPPTKLFLKQAIAGLVPDRNLHRPDKATWTPIPEGRMAAPEVPGSARELLRAEFHELPDQVPTFLAFVLRVLSFPARALESPAAG
jgi:asparagine synthetase B (glutamine-hydrolysing)